MKLKQVAKMSKILPEIFKKLSIYVKSNFRRWIQDRYVNMAQYDNGINY